MKFCEHIEFSIKYAGRVSNVVMDNLLMEFDNMHIADTNVEENITLCLTEMDNNLDGGKFYDVYLGAKKIKEVLRDCNMWTIEEA